MGKVKAQDVCSEVRQEVLRGETFHPAEELIKLKDKTTQ